MKRRKQFKPRPDHNFGFMDRAPDFMTQFVRHWHLMADKDFIEARQRETGAWLGEVPVKASQR